MLPPLPRYIIFLLILLSAAGVRAQYENDITDATLSRQLSNPSSINDLSAAGYRTTGPLTPENAEQLLCNLPLEAEEGIWYSPADNMYLLILKDLSSSDSLGIFILTTEDCRLEPGMRIGTLSATADPRLYRLSLMTRYHPKKGLHLPLDATAKANSNFSRLTIDSPKLRFSFSPSVIIPNLLDMLRMRVNIRYSDPKDKIRDGWIKTYPYTDSESSIIYL
ncbi:MAG: hypothetical protein K2J15_02825 [Muribaculaceae bacterium]|nr:hypothetical protein [Muribaculaceae bacterium]